MAVDVLQKLEELNYKCPIENSWYTTIEEWQTWYQGKTSFHNYQIYNGTTSVSKTRASLEMAKTVCEDKADILLNEHTDLIVADAAAQTFLDLVLDSTNFKAKINDLIEDVGWSGTGAITIVPNKLNPENPVQIDFINALNIYPLAWRNDIITKCAFSSIIVDGILGNKVYIAIHDIDENSGNYIIKNFLFDEESGDRVALPDYLEPEFDTGMQLPTFHIIKLSARNNLDINNPMGVATYAGAIDVLKSIDIAYDSLSNEFILGKKRLFVDTSILKINPQSGIQEPIFDPNDTAFYGFPELSGEEQRGRPIQESNMSLRVKEHVDTIQFNLDALSLKCGLGKGFYKFDAARVNTATEVVSTDSRLFRKVKKDELSLQSTLTGIVKSILQIGSFDINLEISIAFSDNVIEDTNAVAQRSMSEYQQKLISLPQYLMKVYSLREQAALDQATKTMEQLQQFSLGSISTIDDEADSTEVPDEEDVDDDEVIVEE